MLVLSRKASQGIRIPDLGITFRVLKASRGDVLIGIDAPGAVRVLRDELIDHGSAAATSDREQMPGDRLSTAAILSDQINSKLRSIEIGLSMLVSELEDCNYGCAALIVNSLQGEFSNLTELRDLALRAESSLPRDEPAVILNAIDRCESGKQSAEGSVVKRPAQQQPR